MAKKQTILSFYVRKIAAQLVASEYDQEGEGIYLNIPVRMDREDLSLDKDEERLGPPSMYEDTEQNDRLKNKNDMRRQGPQPGPRDQLHLDYPFTETVHSESPREDDQGKEPDNTKAKGRSNDDTFYMGVTEDDDNRETIGFNEGQLDFNPFATSPEQTI